MNPPASTAWENGPTGGESSGEVIAVLLMENSREKLLTLYDGEPTIRPLHYYHHDIDCCARFRRPRAPHHQADARRDAGRRAHLARDLHAGRLGYFDDETCRLEPVENPFGSKVLPMSPE